VLLGTISLYATEHEILFFPGTVFKVNTIDDGVYYLSETTKAEDVPDIELLLPPQAEIGTQGHLTPTPRPLIFEPGSTVMFIGNSGSGKSTLLNSIIGDVRFETVVSSQGKLQYHEPSSSVVLAESVGISDVYQIKEVASQIRTALTHSGKYYLLFVVQQISGRVIPQDATLMEIVVNVLLDLPNLTFGIIVNQVDPKVRDALDKDLKAFNENLQKNLARKAQAVLLLTADERAKYKKNCLLPHIPALEGFISNMLPIVVDKEPVPFVLQRGKA